MIKIRKQIDSDIESIKSITAIATDELRSLYRPTKSGDHINDEKSIHIVAIVNEIVVGIAEYILYDNSVLVRGLAVSNSHRRQRVAHATIDHIVFCAQKDEKVQLALRIIHETGNTNIFLSGLLHTKH